MKKRYTVIALTMFMLTAFVTEKKTEFDLQACWNVQVKPLESNYLAFGFTETLNELEHSREPWQQTTYSVKGDAWISRNGFVKSDSLRSSRRAYSSETEYSAETMLLMDYGDKELHDVTQRMHEEFVFQMARYSPVLLINYFLEKEATLSKESNSLHAIYQLNIRETIVKLFIRKSDHLLDKVTLLINDPMFGDALTTFAYSRYTKSGNVPYAQTISVDKINGKVRDEVTITSAFLTEKADDLLTVPAGYGFKDESRKTSDTAHTVKHNDHIYFVELSQADERALIVEFSDFLLVAEAPLSSENGELIIAEARKIAPAKPIRYFVFGHYHPHYLGGVRAFVHKGATVLSTEPDIPFVQYVVSAPRTLQPDSLHLQPKALKTEIVQEKMIISDGSYSMEIHFIGEKSDHTKDYLVYYFPLEKLLFEDDLAGLPATGPVKKASKRETGLYTSIVDLHLQVDTIVQAWPVKQYGIKTIFAFSELESAVNMK